jgi:choline dehydrogenase-like flavoprotein
LGFCFQGCKSGAKWSTLYTEIPKAEATGKLDLRAQSQVLQIQHDGNGKATGVLYADKNGSHNVQQARIVCVACNSIETARLLLNSSSSQFPNGLANSSGQVGRNYMRHTTGSVFGIFKQLEKAFGVRLAKFDAVKKQTGLTFESFGIFNGRTVFGIQLLQQLFGFGQKSIAKSLLSVEKRFNLGPELTVLLVVSDNGGTANDERCARFVDED